MSTPEPNSVVLDDAGTLSDPFAPSAPGPLGDRQAGRPWEAGRAGEGRSRDLGGDVSTQQAAIIDLALKSRLPRRHRRLAPDAAEPWLAKYMSMLGRRVEGVPNPWSRRSTRPAWGFRRLSEKCPTSRFGASCVQPG